MADIEQIGKGSPDGAVFGGSASELIAFHGSTPCDQSGGFAAVSTSAPIQSGYGFTVTQATAIIADINLLRACLVEKGLMASS